MDMAELLNPTIESHNLFETTDNDIFNSVMDAKQFEENAGGDNGNGNGNGDDIALTGPTCREALQASLILRKYVASLNDPSARRLELMLGSFGQWTRAVKMQGTIDTKLTDYFVHK
jgi:hypothetical protein